MGWLLLSHGHALPSICWQGCSSPRAAALLPSCHLLDALATTALLALPITSTIGLTQN